MYSIPIWKCADLVVYLLQGVPFSLSMKNKILKDVSVREAIGLPSTKFRAYGNLKNTNIKISVEPICIHIYM